MEYPKILDMESYQEESDNIYGLNTKYKFFGISEHVGSSGTSGHYRALTMRDGNYFRFDDEDFMQVNEKEALSGEAYLLFYQ